MREGYAAYDFQGVFQALFQFATVDLSAFYFDIRKDALYCDAADSPRRRAARTVLDALYDRLVDLARADAALHDGGGLARAASGRGRARCTCIDFPATPGEWRDPALGREMGARARRPAAW